jgi:tetratricopeptide (TPR) repeat protein
MARPRLSPLGLAAALPLLVWAGVARADARADIAEIRDGRLPVRHEMLGWTPSGDAVVRSLVCASSGTTSCSADIATLGPSRATATGLLDINEVYCTKGSPCAALDAAVAAAFIAAESKAMAALPARTPASALADPASAFGVVAGSRTRLAFRQLAVKRGDLEGVSLELVVHGPRGATEPLATLTGLTQRIETAPTVVAAYPSPDGKRVAIVVRYATGVMCWGPTDQLDVRVIDVAPRQASLANSAGFRAYAAGDLAEAHRDFVEATATNPAYALAWFNRAAVESRLGKLDDATSSLAKAEALDPSMMARACKDRDFDALAADGRARAQLVCK